MLTKWKLHNFKSFKNENEFDLAPLTIFCGANSSGKSSIIQSILLIKQTIQDSPYDYPLSLNGPLVQLGAYKDVVNHLSYQNSEDQLGLGWVLKTNEEKRYLRYSRKEWSSFQFDISYDSKNTGNKHNPKLVPRLKKCILSAKEADTQLEFFDEEKAFIHIERPQRKRDIKIKYNGEPLSGYSFIIRELDKQSTSTIKETFGGKGTLISVNTWHFIPESILVQYDEAKTLCEQKLNTILEGRNRLYSHELMPKKLKKQIYTIVSKIDQLSQRTINNFKEFNEHDVVYEEWEAVLPRMPRERRLVRQALKDNRAALQKTIENTTKSNIVIDSRYIEFADDASRIHNNFFRFKLKYLGPLRDEPKAAYPLQSSTSQGDVGIKGERTAAVINLNENTMIDYLDPQGFEQEDFEFTPKRGTLKKALVEWLQYLKVAHEVRTENQGKLGHLLQVKTTQKGGYHDLTNVGVGVSQVLPIIVMCLMSTEDETLIFEQPELHLNPSVQTKLADFFASMILTGRQCLVETHSEYIIERLRYRIAQEPDKNIVDKTKIYFFTNEQGSTKSTSINLTRFGSIIDWPEDFFDQSMRESQQILQAATKKKKKEKTT